MLYKHSFRLLSFFGLDPFGCFVSYLIIWHLYFCFFCPGSVAAESGFFISVYLFSPGNGCRRSLGFFMLSR